MLSLLALCGLVALLALELQRSREREIDFAWRDIDALARSLEQHVSGTIGKIDVVLRKVARDYPRLAGLSDEQANRELEALLASIPESQSLRVVNNAGRFILDASGMLSTAYIGDRDYFLRHKNDPQSGLVISEPIFARVTHNWVFTVSRRLASLRGDFVGHVQGAINADHFADFYRTLNLGAHDTVTLLDDRMRLIARHPPIPEALGKPIDSPPVAEMLAKGEASLRYSRASALDGRERLMNARKLPDLPFVIIVGRATEDILAGWQTKAFAYAGSVALLGIALAILIFVWQRSYYQALRAAGELSTALDANERRARVLLDSLPDPAWLRDENSRFIAVNEAYLALCGKPREAVIGQEIEAVWPPGTAARFRAQDELVRREKIVTRDEEYLDNNPVGGYFEYIRSPVFDEEGHLIGIAGLARDLTERKQAEDRIRYIAEHDSLTDLPNRLLLNSEMSHAIAHSVGAEMRLALLLLDLDHFKNVNDTLGHATGDQLLLQVAERLRSVVHEKDTISRQGGDEFAIMLVDCANTARVALIAQRLLDAIGQPFRIGDRELTITASIGIGVYPDDGADIDSLLKNADTALYSAKSSARNAYRFFAPAMNARIRERMQLEHSLRHAIERRELALHYQPQYDARSGTPIGVEALLRWRHGDEGFIPPARFIPVAEDTGLILPIGEWVLFEACRQAVAWQQDGMAPLTVAVNLSAAQLSARNLVATVAAALERSGLPAAQLELELTESMLMQDRERALVVLGDLRRLGIRLSIDDFGTGYSSLSYLKHLPIDKVKIDQSFVRDITSDTNDAAITQAIIAIAGKLGLQVIAEGVETADQFALLREYGCDAVQGYYLGYPMPAQDLPSALHATRH